MLTADDIVDIIRPVKDRASDDVWREAMARLGGEVEVAYPAAAYDGEPVDEYAAKVARSKTVPQYAALINQKERTVWEWVQREKVASFKTHGGRRLIDPADNPPDPAG